MLHIVRILFLNLKYMYDAVWFRTRFTRTILLLFTLNHMIAKYRFVSLAKYTFFT